MIIPDFSPKHFEVYRRLRTPVRNEDERPFPAFEFGNEWASLGEAITSEDSDNLGIKTLNRFYSYSTQFLR
jgi:hypothetical protein